MGLDDLDFEIPEPEIVDVTELSASELADRYVETIEKLKQSKEALYPQTQEGRDLHSLRTALLVELRKRGLR